MTDALSDALCALPGVYEGTSRFAGRPAWYVDDVEVAHLEADGRLDVRLKRWTKVGTGDLAAAVEVVRQAVEAHRRQVP